MELSDKTRELFTAINQQNRNHYGAKRHLDYIRESLLEETNKKIEAKVLAEYPKHLPKIVIGSTLLQQFRIAAQKTSQKKNKPTEVSGFCSGRIKNKNWYLGQFNAYAIQQCSSVRTSASGFGRILSDNKRKDKNLVTAHSHNIMSCFHSGTDTNTLKQNVRDSQYFCTIDKIVCPFAYNIVFNEFTSIEKKPFIEGGICIPEYTPNGIQHKKVHLFKIPRKLLHYAKERIIGKKNSRRIYREVNTAVN